MTEFYQTHNGIPLFGELQRTYNWQVVLPDFGRGDFEVSKYIQSISFGQFEIKYVSEQHVSVYKRFFPDGFDIDIARITLAAPVNNIIYPYFRDWKYRIVDYQGFYGLPIDYKQNIEVILLDGDGKDFHHFKLLQCFPISFPAYKLDFEDEKVLFYEVSFRIEGVEEVFDSPLIASASTHMGNIA